MEVSFQDVISFLQNNKIETLIYCFILYFLFKADITIKYPRKKN